MSSQYSVSRRVQSLPGNSGHFHHTIIAGVVFESVPRQAGETDLIQRIDTMKCTYYRPYQCFC